MNRAKHAFKPIELLEHGGFDREAIYTQLMTMGRLSREEAEARCRLLIYLLPSAVALSKCPHAALQMGQLDILPPMGAFGFALQSCANLGDALNLMHRYYPLIKQDVQWRTISMDKGAALRLNIETGSPDQKRLMTEFAFSNCFFMAKLLIGKALPASELQLQYPKPDYHGNYPKFLPTRLRFGQPYNQLLLSAEALHSPVRTANSTGHILFRQQCEELLHATNRVENTSAAVRRMLMQSAGDFPGIDQVADRLHMSKSTLGRRLESESTSFRSITDQVKNLLAKEYLTNTELSVADIAHLLDYADTANFRRAFVRWNGKTPCKFRLVGPSCFDGAHGLKLES
jgi:AraC-like DNA-binding protein